MHTQWCNRQKNGQCGHYPTYIDWAIQCVLTLKVLYLGALSWRASSTAKRSKQAKDTILSSMRQQISALQRHPLLYDMKRTTFSGNSLN